MDNSLVIEPNSNIQLGDATDNWDIVRISEEDGDEDRDLLAVVQTESLAKLLVKGMSSVQATMRELNSSIVEEMASSAVFNMPDIFYDAKSFGDDAIPQNKAHNAILDMVEELMSSLNIKIEGAPERLPETITETL